MLQLLIITSILIGICFLALGVRVWIKGKFADTEVGHNPNMRKLGIRCAKEEELLLWRSQNNSQPFSGCSSCTTCGIENCSTKQ